MRRRSNANRCWRMLFLGIVLLYLFPVKGWTQTKPIEGIRENTPNVHALINARIIQAPDRIIKKGTVVLRDGVIEAVGANIEPPPDARIWDYEGLTLYPGLIESYSQIGLPGQQRGRSQANRGDNQESSDQAGASYWNQYVKPEHDVLTVFKPESDDVKRLRSLGFTVAAVVRQNGLFTGSSALVSLSDKETNEQLLKEDLAQNIMFRRPGGRGFGGGYPNSQMGVISLIRQIFLDTDWYIKAQKAHAANPNGQSRPETNESLAALEMVVQGRHPVLFNIEDDLNFLRAVKIIQEFNLNAWVLGSGYEYRQLDLVKRSGVPVILPVNFPEPPDVESPENALSVSLEDLSHWEFAPENPGRLARAGVKVALTSANLRNSDNFPKQVRTAIERGLSESEALAALTTTPASILGVQSQLGTIDRGKLAHMVVTDGDLFKDGTQIFDVWVDGMNYQVKKRSEIDPRGKWQLTLNVPDKQTIKAELNLTGEVDKLSGSLKQDTTALNLKSAKMEFARLILTVPGKELGFDGVVRMSGAVEENKLVGSGELPDGTRFSWIADSREPHMPKSSPEKKQSESAASAKSQVSPPGAFGRSGPPEQPKAILVSGATIWTSGPQGTLEDVDMLVTNGKIVQIGKGLQTPKDALVIDAKGKHVSPGLIDAHSHSGLSAVNEGSQAVTAEVSVADVIDSYDIALYRELAGGLTVANQLHGSANPIGGKNSVIKLRWGAPPDALLMEDAFPGIKFALGENVKRSRAANNDRYPDTRMGVEQIIRDRFHAALDYEKAWENYNSSKKKNEVVPPRRDLELETLLEIIHGKRVVHSHSYRQDEILMLVRVAEDFGFTIAAFQHVLEGYKVADVLAKHGAGASTFSDWWGYKFEVYDAIPYNGALMHNAGVVVSFNSDSGELARRLNLEAAKAVKYGGVPKEEALKFVTLNPAIQLRIDNRVGSLEPGKDADFVIWSGSPLSTYSKCEQTWIDGKKYFDLNEDLKMRELVKSERARLIQKVLAAKGEERAGPQRGKRRPAN